jgi:hypothetical protein
MPSPSYVRQRLWRAVESLDGTSPSQRQRLSNAGRALIHLRPEDFLDEESRLDFTAITDTLHGLETPHPDGTITASVIEMSDEQVAALERRIRALQARWPLDD